MKHATEYFRGEISFDEFARRNNKDWMRMARYLLRRFPAEFTAEEDVAQELLLGAWLALKRFDPARGVTAERYVVYNAMSKAKKRMRRVLRPVGEHLSDTVEDDRQTPSQQDEELERRARLQRLIERCSTLTEAVCLMAYYREEECALAATSVYFDPELRRLCRFGSLTDATRKMRRVLQHIQPTTEETDA